MFWLCFSVILSGFVFWASKRLAPGRRWSLIGPFAVMQFSFLIYCAIGPAYLLLTTELTVIGIDLRESIGRASAASLVAYASMCLGYILARKELVPKLVENEKQHGIAVLSSLIIYTGAYILTLASVGFNASSLYNFFGNTMNLMEGASLGGLQTYFYLSMSAMIAPIVLLALLPGGKSFMVATFMGINAIAIYVTTGFRIRVALLFLAVGLALLARSTLMSKGRLPLIRILQVGLFGLFLISSMSIARKYGHGVDRSIISSASTDDFVSGFFKDTSIFYMGGKVISLYDEDDNRSHTYFQTVVDTAIRAIPSEIYGQKPIPSTMVAIQDAMGGTPAAISSGFAVPFYVEYFIMFGWPGLLFLSATLGFICALIENRFSGFVTLYHLLFYVMLSSYMFMYFHRGYLPQQADYFFFIVVLPLLMLWPFRRNLV